jgi:hypothetical protein
LAAATPRARPVCLKQQVAYVLGYAGGPKARCVPDDNG